VARFAQETSTETLDGRDTVVTGWTVLLPAGTVLSAGDRIRDQHGIVFEVDGAPAVWTIPRGEHHLAVRLREVGEL
jgi:hypothetical protein